MKLKSYEDEEMESLGWMADFRTALWVGFWLYILQAGEPSLLGAVIGWIGRQ